MAVIFASTDPYKANMHKVISADKYMCKDSCHL